MNTSTHKLKIGIVEDDMIIAGAITEMLQEVGYDVPESASRYSEAIEMIENEKPDLLLLDIHLVGKMDGIDLAEIVRNKFRVPFIFLTANMDQKTVERAKAVFPSAFLVKPVTRDQLHTAIEIAFNNYSSPQTHAESGREEHAQSKTFAFVRDGHAFRKVHYDDILYLESEANYVALHLADKKKILLRSSLDEFIRQLDAARFVRTHRGYAVNIGLIDGVYPGEVSVNGVRLPVGRTHKEEVMKVLGLSDPEG